MRFVSPNLFLDSGQFADSHVLHNYQNLFILKHTTHRLDAICLFGNVF